MNPSVGPYWAFICGAVTFEFDTDPHAAMAQELQHAVRPKHAQFTRAFRVPLAIFRYATPCGTVYGHTGNFPGYVQWAAATADGRRSVTTSLNIAAPTGSLLRQLRAVQASAVCALLGK